MDTKERTIGKIVCLEDCVWNHHHLGNCRSVTMISAVNPPDAALHGILMCIECMLKLWYLNSLFSASIGLRFVV
jgi:hypothetical protein